jgi:hypothetical protein
LLAEIKALSQKSIGAIATIFKTGIDQGIYVDRHPMALADIFWSMFSGVVLWEASKKVLRSDKDYLKSTLATAFELFERGIVKSS